MRKTLALFTALLTSTPLVANGASQFECSEPQGMRADYSGNQLSGESWIGSFLDSWLNKKVADKIEWSQDRFSNLYPEVTIDERDISVAWGNAVPSSIKGLVDQGRSTYRIPITGRDAISVWGTRSQNNTAELWRFYLSNRTLYLLQSSIGLLSSTSPQASIYISHCKLK